MLAPTYVSSGVGGKPTVEFSTVNVQVVSGSGTTDGAVNGEGNLVVGYAEHPSNHAQTGSNNLVVGTNNGWSSYGGIIAGRSNRVTHSYDVVAGESNVVSGSYGFAAGDANTASGSRSSVLGGFENQATGNAASVSGGELNLASGQYSSALGGLSNVASGQLASLAAGEFNIANDGLSFIGGGCDNITGSGTANANACDAGGEGISGGAKIAALGADMTAGAITDGVNVGAPGNFKISLGLAAGACAVLPYGVPGAAVGDLATIAYETNPPAGLLIQTTGVTVANQVEVEACNVSSATIHYDNIPIRVQTFR